LTKRIDVVIGATEAKKKKGVHYFFSPLRAKRNSFFMCACCKELFYDNSAGFGGNSVQFIMKKINELL
jgi:hypothetical protein